MQNLQVLLSIYSPVLLVIVLWAQIKHWEYRENKIMLDFMNTYSAFIDDLSYSNDKRLKALAASIFVFYGVLILLAFMPKYIFYTGILAREHEPAVLAFFAFLMKAVFLLAIATYFTLLFSKYRLQIKKILKNKFIKYLFAILLLIPTFVFQSYINNYLSMLTLINPSVFASYQIIATVFTYFILGILLVIMIPVSQLLFLGIVYPLAFLFLKEIPSMNFKSSFLRKSVTLLYKIILISYVSKAVNKLKIRSFLNYPYTLINLALIVGAYIFLILFFELLPSIVEYYLVFLKETFVFANFQENSGLCSNENTLGTSIAFINHEYVLTYDEACVIEFNIVRCQSEINE